MAEKKPTFAEASASKEKLNTEELEKKIEELEKQKNEYLAGWQRARADFLNYKKEEMERIGDILKYANEGLILKMLPILDNFEVIEKKLPDDLKNDNNVKGILQIKSQILDFLKSQGIEEIKSVGENFNPDLHEVVEKVEPAEGLAERKKTGLESAKASVAEEISSEIIIEEIQKGYKINGRLLRPAKVRVATK